MNFFQFHEPEAPRRETAEEIRARYEPEPVPAYETMPHAGSYKSPCEDGVYRTYDERRAWEAGKKHAQSEFMAALENHRAVTKRTLELFAGTMGEKFGQHRKAIPELIEAAMEGFGKAAAEGVNKRFAKAVEGMKAELFDRVEAEIAAAVKDIRSAHDGIERQAERLANRAAERACERAVVRLSNEVEELRREIEALRAERANVRVLR